MSRLWYWNLIDRGLTKDKNVGFVLERLIGAMTVQQKMDSLKGAKEEISKIDEDQHNEIHKTVQEVFYLVL